jgi:hypothetical protein
MVTQTHAKTINKTTLSPQERKAANSQKKIDRFKKLAVVRMNRAIKAVDAVSALGNRRSYTYNDDQVQKIKTALQSSVSKVEKAFSATTQNDAGFSL